MKVLHVIPSVAVCRGGPSTAIIAMARALMEAGVEVDVVASNDNGPGTLAVPTGEFSSFEGCRVCFLPRWSPRIGALREFQYSGAFSAWFREHAPRYDGIHIHAVFSYFSTRAMQLSRELGKPFILRPLGLLDPWSLRQKLIKKRLYYALFERKNLAAARAVHCTSPAEAEHVRLVLPQARTLVVPHGVNVPPPVTGAAAALRAELNLAAEVPVLLFMSRWHPKKNIPLLLEALAAMRDHTWHLVLAGAASNGYGAEVRRGIDRYALHGRVSCPGHVIGQERARLLYGSDVFVLPSLAENFGLAVAEAAACGLRCVITTGVDLAETIIELEAGSVCEPDATSLKAALLRELHSMSDRSSAASAARQRFSWQRNAATLAAIYAEHFAPSISFQP